VGWHSEFIGSVCFDSLAGYREKDKELLHNPSSKSGYSLIAEQFKRQIDSSKTLPSGHRLHSSGEDPKHSEHSPSHAKKEKVIAEAILELLELDKNQKRPSHMPFVSLRKKPELQVVLQIFSSEL